MKLRERWLPLAATLALVALCAAAPFLWFALRDRQLTRAAWADAGQSDFLSAAGRENAVARELYYWREQGAASTYDLAEPVDAATARQAVQPALQALRGAKVLPDALLTAAEDLVAGAAQPTRCRPAAGMTEYTFDDGQGRYLWLCLSDGGALAQIRGDVGSGGGFEPAAVAAAYRAMLGLDGFADWQDAAPLGYGDPAPSYSADAQLYLIANIDRGYFSLSVTSMSPETFAGLQ